MAGHEKLNVKIQIKMTQQEKANLDKDIPFLSKQVKKQTGAKITKSQFLRLVAEDLHEKLSAGETIVWPPQLQVDWAAKPKPKKKT